MVADEVIYFSGIAHRQVDWVISSERQSSNGAKRRTPTPYAPTVAMEIKELSMIK